MAYSLNTGWERRSAGTWAIRPRGFESVSRGVSGIMQRLTQSSGDAELIPILEHYASANLAATDRKPIEQAIDRIRFDAERRTRNAPQIVEWLRTHPA